MSIFLGIDTSNYTTSVALYDSVNNKVVQYKKLLPVKDGELGLRQSDAVFHHTAQLPSLLSQLFSENKNEICAVGVSSRPRSIEGSYMPCFSVGLGHAKVLSSALNIPMYELSHQQGHIAAAAFSAEKTDLLKQRFLAFHISGGTTEALLVDGTNGEMKIDIVGKTLDLNAGQLVDRVGLKLGCKFPCGKELEALALSASEKSLKGLKLKPCIKDCDCCLSGFENICEKMISQGVEKELVARSVLAFIENTLLKMTENIFSKYGSMPTLFAGGVMSNSIIKANLQSKLDCYFALPEFSCDNAAGVAYLASKMSEK